MKKNNRKKESLLKRNGIIKKNLGVNTTEGEKVDEKVKNMIEY